MNLNHDTENDIDSGVLDALGGTPERSSPERRPGDGREHHAAAEPRSRRRSRERLASQCHPAHQRGGVRDAAQPRRRIDGALKRDRDAPEPSDGMPAARIAGEKICCIAGDQRRPAHAADPRGEAQRLTPTTIQRPSWACSSVTVKGATSICQKARIGAPSA